MLSNILPVPFILEEPVSVRFSTLLEAVKLSEEKILSVPPETPEIVSVTVSLVLSTI